MDDHIKAEIAHHVNKARQSNMARIVAEERAKAASERCKLSLDQAATKYFQSRGVYVGYTFTSRGITRKGKVTRVVVGFDGRIVAANAARFVAMSVKADKGGRPVDAPQKYVADPADATDPVAPFNFVIETDH